MPLSEVLAQNTGNTKQSHRFEANTWAEQHHNRIIESCLGDTFAHLHSESMQCRQVASHIDRSFNGEASFPFFPSKLDTIKQK